MKVTNPEFFANEIRQSTVILTSPNAEHSVQETYQLVVDGTFTHAMEFGSPKRRTLGSASYARVMGFRSARDNLDHRRAIVTRSSQLRCVRLLTTMRPVVAMSTASFASRGESESTL